MPRTDRTRAALVLWGGWLVVTGGAFSLGQGIIHPYYTVALAPAIGAIVGIGATRLWNGRSHPAARAASSSSFAATAWWAYVLLGPHARLASRAADVRVARRHRGQRCCSSRARRPRCARGAGAIAAAAVDHRSRRARPRTRCRRPSASRTAGAIPAAGPPRREPAVRSRRRRRWRSAAGGGQSAEPAASSATRSAMPTAASSSRRRGAAGRGARTRAAARRGGGVRRTAQRLDRVERR